MVSIKRTLCVLLSFILLLPFFVFGNSIESDALAQIKSTAYIVCDVKTGQIYAAQNENTLRYPASITKLLTAALALENGDPNDVITISQQSVILPEEATRAGFIPGEQIKVHDVLMAACLLSGNDAANALAEYVAGSEQEFVKLMNKKALELGCTGTSFGNPSGLYQDDHYTTALDMAKIMQYVATVPDIFDYIGAVQYTMQPTNMYYGTREFENGCLMLAEGEFKYRKAIGGKTGWVTASKHTMVTYAKHGTSTLVAIVLDSEDRRQKFDDTKILFDYCFDNFYKADFYPPEFSLELLDGSTKTIKPNKIRLALPFGVTVDDIHATYTGVDNIQTVIYNGYITLCLNNKDQQLPTNFYVEKISIENQGIFDMDFDFENPITSLIQSEQIPIATKILVATIVLVLVCSLVIWFRHTLCRVKHMGHRHRRKRFMQTRLEMQIKYDYPHFAKYLKQQNTTNTSE